MYSLQLSPFCSVSFNYISTIFLWSLFDRISFVYYFLAFSSSALCPRNPCLILCCRLLPWWFLLVVSSQFWVLYVWSIWSWLLHRVRGIVFCKLTSSFPIAIYLKSCLFFKGFRNTVEKELAGDALFSCRLSSNLKRHISKEEQIYDSAKFRYEDNIPKRYLNVENLTIEYYSSTKSWHLRQMVRIREYSII